MTVLCCMLHVALAATAAVAVWYWLSTQEREKKKLSLVHLACLSVRAIIPFFGPSHLAACRKCAARVKITKTFSISSFLSPT